MTARLMTVCGCLLRTDSPIPALTGWRLDCGQPEELSDAFDAARNIDHDRRLAKPAIVMTIEGVRSGCAWRWSRCGMQSVVPQNARR
jgi:hypothetical protein